MYFFLPVLISIDLTMIDYDAAISLELSFFVFFYSLCHSVGEKFWPFVWRLMFRGSN